MLEELFAGRPVARARQCAAPLLEERRSFLAHLNGLGYAHGTLRAVACELIVIAERIDLSGTQKVGAAIVDAAARRWAAHQLRRHYSTSPRLSVRNFRYWAEQWLRYLGRWIETPPTARPFQGLLENFSVYMADVQGSHQPRFGRIDGRQRPFLRGTRRWIGRLLRSRSRTSTTFSR